MKLNNSMLQEIIMAAYMSIIMAAIMCAIIVAISYGFTADYFAKVLQAWLLSAPIAFFTLQLVRPIAHKLTVFTLQFGNSK